MSVAFIFPGQGSQEQGMLHSLPKHPVVARTLEEAGSILECDILKLDPGSALGADGVADFKRRSQSIASIGRCSAGYGWRLVRRGLWCSCEFRRSAF